MNLVRYLSLILVRRKVESIRRVKISHGINTLFASTNGLIIRHPNLLIIQRVSRCLFNSYLLTICGQLLYQLSHLHEKCFYFFIVKVTALFYLFFVIYAASLTECAVKDLAKDKNLPLETLGWFALRDCLKSLKLSEFGSHKIRKQLKTRYNTRLVENNPNFILSQMFVYL